MAMLGYVLSLLQINVCSDIGVKHIMVIIGYIISVVKVVIPIIIIIVGTKNMIKATLVDESQIKKEAEALFIRFIVGAVIFFIPTVVQFIFTQMVKSDINNQFLQCTKCMLTPSKCYQEVLKEKEEERKQLQNSTQNIHNQDDLPSYGINTDYHVNSINGIKYNLYNQVDERWSSVGNIGQDGCHIVSAAVVASAHNSNINPAVVYGKHTNSYPYMVVNDMAGESFSCKHITSSNSKEKIIENLRKGNPIVIMVYGRKKGGASPFTTSQHYMALIDYKDNKIFVGNSYSSSGYGRSGWYDKDEVLTSVQEVNLCIPTEKAINNVDDNIELEKITFEYSYHNDSKLRYALYTPSSATNNSNIPLIVWLHGSGEINASENVFKNSGLLSILNNWTLDGFNAYVLCPVSIGDWIKVKTSLLDLIEQIATEKNINKNKIILVGHSMGGIGVQTIANGNVDYFSSYVILSGYSSGVDLSQFKNKRIKIYAGSPSYGEDYSSYNYTVGILTKTFGNENVTILNTWHGNVPKMAFNLDYDKNNKSDLIEWMLR